MCDTTGRTPIGSVIYDLSTDTIQITITLNTDLGTINIDQFHLYVGQDMLPKDIQGGPTTAPGQFPYVSPEYTLSNSPFYSSCEPVSYELPDAVYAPGNQHTLAQGETGLYVVLHFATRGYC